jgi:DNA/RNA-binding domain of Phe-tRNA-synthetase-like protein
VLRDVSNPAHDEGLEKKKAELERELRKRFAGQDRAAILEHPFMKAYQAHYRRFNKTYHVQLQLESIVFKAKAVPTGAALIEAMFMAELDDMLLTAGHDLDSVGLPLILGVARGTESYTLLRGSEQTPKAGDMMISDTDGIISSIVYGPDSRTQIRPETCNAVFTAYAPPGIGREAVEAHLKKIRENVMVFAPGARTELLRTYGAPG